MEYAIRTLVVLGVCYLIVSLYFVTMEFALIVLQLSFHSYSLNHSVTYHLLLIRSYSLTICFIENCSIL